jgi:hypothetical protein
MATKEQIREALKKAGDALKELETLVNEGIPKDMWTFDQTEEEDLENVDEAYEIAALLFPMYMEESYYEVENYADSLIGQVDG